MTTFQLILGAAVWLLLTFSAAVFGSRFRPDEWYRQLAKPTWTPPDAIFAPVWIILYLFMAGAAWLVWKRHGVAGAVVPLALFMFQLALNGAWSWLFFGRRHPKAAFVDIVALWVVILATLISFWQLEPLAGILLIPYLVWVSVAAALNWVIWRMNR